MELAVPLVEEKPASYVASLALLTVLFFSFGFITALNDILTPHLKQQFSLDYTQAMWAQFTFFLAYGVISLPAGALVSRFGHQKSIALALSISGSGCLLFYPAAAYQRYGLFLFALFCLASGITLLQVASNPYVAALGSAETASSRLTLTQAFNSLGTTLAPYVGAGLILSTTTPSQTTIQGLYVVLATCLFALAILLSRSSLPAISTSTAESNTKQMPEAPLWQNSTLCRR
jgi:FHS family L-fucose permease-like MFS transporter